MRLKDLQENNQRMSRILVVTEHVAADDFSELNIFVLAFFAVSRRRLRPEEGAPRMSAI